jgi:hypothetical protein
MSWCPQATKQYWFALRVYQQCPIGYIILNFELNSDTNKNKNDKYFNFFAFFDMNFTFVDIT